MLIVDDEPVARDLLRMALELEGGFTVVAEASAGREAIELARSHQPDLVLLDLLTPGMGGLEAVGHMAGVAPTAKVIVLTAIDRSCVAPDTIARLAGLYDKTSDLSAVTHELAILLGAAPQLRSTQRGLCPGGDGVGRRREVGGGLGLARGAEGRTIHRSS